MEPNNGGAPVQSMQPHTDKSIGPAIGIIVIIAVIVLGGLYFWGQRIDQQKAVTPVVQDTSTTVQQDAMMQASADAMQAQNTADDTATIEADLSATNVTTPDPGVVEINSAASTQ